MIFGRPKAVPRNALILVSLNLQRNEIISFETGPLEDSFFLRLFWQSLGGFASGHWKKKRETNKMPLLIQHSIEAENLAISTYSSRNYV